MRVVHIFAPNYRHRFSGPFIQWRYYFSEWDEPIIEHYVMEYPSYQINPAKESFDFSLTEQQKPVSKLNQLVWMFRLLFALFAQRKDYDILHVHVLWWTGLLLGPYSRILKKIALYESVLLGEDTPGGIIQERLGRFKVWCLKKYSSILAISQALKEDYLAQDFSKENVYLQMNCLDLNIFSPDSSEKDRSEIRRMRNYPIDANIIVFVGSVIERKGLDILIDGFILAHEENPNLYLVIAGPEKKSQNPSIDENFVIRLKHRIQEHGLSERVIFEGLIDNHKTIAEIYRAADVFVFPSRHEGLPTVVLEAMASGLPVIASDLPGLRSVIQNGENGFILPAEGDRGEAIREILRFMTLNPQEAAKIAINGRAYIEKNHTFPAWQGMMAEHYQVLKSRQGFVQ